MRKRKEGKKDEKKKEDKISLVVKKEPNKQGHKYKNLENKR